MNFLEALQQSGIEVKERDSKPGEYAICCPFCIDRGETADETFRLGVNLNTGFAH